MVPRLLLLFRHRGDNVDHAFPVGGDAHLRPAVEVELTHRPCFVLLIGTGERGESTGHQDGSTLCLWVIKGKLVEGRGSPMCLRNRS